MPTLYLDACCLNRPFDDQLQDRIHLEAEAVLIILEHIKNGDWQWVASDALKFEIEQTPDPERRTRVGLLGSYAHRSVIIEASITQRAKELENRGFHAVDALHLAYAENGGVDVFLTTDDQLLRQSSRNANQLRVQVKNPLTWLKEVTEI